MASRPRKQVDPIDTGPPERLQHNKVRIERDINNRARLRVVDQIEIDRLLLQGLITMDQHTAGEHLYRLITSAGYFPATKWALEANIRGDVQSMSKHRSDALVKIGLSRVWLYAKAGPATTRYLWRVILGEGKVPDKALDAVRSGLSAFQSFEAWWHGRDVDQSIPALLSDMPRNVQTHRPRSFHHEV